MGDSRLNALALSLLVLGVGTNYHNSALTANNGAFLTDFTDGCSNFHAFVLATLQRQYYIYS